METTRGCPRVSTLHKMRSVANHHQCRRHYAQLMTSCEVEESCRSPKTDERCECRCEANVQECNPVQSLSNVGVNPMIRSVIQSNHSPLSRNTVQRGSVRKERRQKHKERNEDGVQSLSVWRHKIPTRTPHVNVQNPNERTNNNEPTTVFEEVLSRLDIQNVVEEPPDFRGKPLVCRERHRRTKKK